MHSRERGVPRRCAAPALVSFGRRPAPRVPHRRTNLYSRLPGGRSCGFPESPPSRRRAAGGFRGAPRQDRETREARGPCYRRSGGWRLAGHRRTLARAGATPRPPASLPPPALACRAAPIVEALLCRALPMPARAQAETYHAVTPDRVSGGPIVREPPARSAPRIARRRSTPKRPRRPGDPYWSLTGSPRATSLLRSRAERSSVATSRALGTSASGWSTRRVGRSLARTERRFCPLPVSSRRMAPSAPC
jgi:hypothetical protein